MNLLLTIAAFTGAFALVAIAALQAGREVEALGLVALWCMLLVGAYRSRRQHGGDDLKRQAGQRG